jgi:hypothetical protein
MIRKLIPLLAAAMMGGGVAAYASSAIVPASTVTWPATCTKVVFCVDSHLNALHATVAAQGAAISRLQARNRYLATCITEYPVTRYYAPFYYYYGNDSNGDGNFDQNVFQNNASNMLDQTRQGDNVGSWFVRDTCGIAAFGRPPAP